MYSRLCLTSAVAMVLVLTSGLVACGPDTSNSRPIHVVDSNDEEADSNDASDNGGSSTDNDTDDSSNSSDPGDERPDGAACSEDGDCASGTCLTSQDWPEGYCSAVGCQSNADCHGGDYDSFCLINPQGNDFCTRRCTVGDGEACRDGYACRSSPEGDGGWCGAEPDEPGPAGGNDGEVADYDLEIKCQSVASQSTEFQYDIAGDTASYLVVPFSPNGELISPKGITTPGGTYLDFENDFPFLLSGAQLFGIINPTLIPATPELEYQVESGTHTYHLQTNDDEICHYVLEDAGNPTTLHLNVYLVGLPGVDADSAPTDDDLQSLLDQTDEIFDEAGIQLGNIRYFDVPEEAEQNYSIIRSRQDVSDLAGYSQTPGSTVEDAVSANIFITEQFSFSDGSNTVGISLGIPGAAGLHESHVSGVVMTGEYLGSPGGGTATTAVTMAHELGHFLGLFHTTERGGEAADPLEDTPECDDLTSPSSCPDWGNLMFPTGGASNTEVTDDQTHVIGANPLTH